MVVPPLSISSPKNDSTSDFGATAIVLNWPSTVSNQTTTNHVDTDVSTFSFRSVNKTPTYTPTYVRKKTYQTSQGTNYISHQMSNRPAD